MTLLCKFTPDCGPNQSSAVFVLEVKNCDWKITSKDVKCRKKPSNDMLAEMGA